MVYAYHVCISYTVVWGIVPKNPKINTFWPKIEKNELFRKNRTKSRCFFYRKSFFDPKIEKQKLIFITIDFTRKKTKKNRSFFAWNWFLPPNSKKKTFFCHNSNKTWIFFLKNSKKKTRFFFAGDRFLTQNRKLLYYFCLIGGTKTQYTIYRMHMWA